MPESLTKRKRPERQLYVPPAQRVSRLSTKKVTSDLCVLNLSDFVNFFANTFLCNIRSLSKFQYQHHNCSFKKFLYFKKHTSRFDCFIQIYNLPVASDVYWNLNQFQCINPVLNNYQTHPVYDFNDLQVTNDKPSVSFSQSFFSYLISRISVRFSEFRRQ